MVFHPRKRRIHDVIDLNFSRNIRLRICYVFITTIPKRVCFIAKVELPSVSISFQNVLGGLRACGWGRTPARQARAFSLFRTFLNVLGVGF